MTVPRHRVKRKGAGASADIRRSGTGPRWARVTPGNCRKGEVAQVARDHRDLTFFRPGCQDWPTKARMIAAPDAVSS